MAPRSTRLIIALTTVWLCGVASGLYVLWAYDNKPGVSAVAPARWPATSGLVPSTSGPTLLFVAHPQCTCTRASLDELAEILARAATHPKTYILFLKPSTTDASWEQTDLLKRAAALPGVRVIRDDDGVEAQRFGVQTSGQTFLYDSHGALVFSGGITGSRGHAGENTGELSLISLLSHSNTTDRRATSVFGCPLFAKAD
jgi:hypothetical protein